MRRARWPVYLWPGLPQLWLEGTWSALALAVGCAALLNLLVLSTFLWVELLAARLVVAGWVVLAVLWAGSATASYHVQQTRKRDPQGGSAEDLFREAQSEYLRGNWFIAETILSRLIDHNPRDLEARLLLATLLRHTNRYKEASDHLARLERLEGAVKWQLEIAGERDRLRTRNNPADLSSDSDTQGQLQVASQAA